MNLVFIQIKKILAHILVVKKNNILKFMEI